jgi:mRNA export factor
MSLFSTSATAGLSPNQSTTVDLSQDLQVQGPEDSISEIAFSPTAEIMSVASWDNKIRIYEIGQGGVNGKAMYEHTGPVLTTHFSKDGSKLASGSADKTAKMFDLGSGQNQQVAAHDMPIKSVKFINVNGTEALATASWDKTLKYWDLRRKFFQVKLRLIVEPNPIASVDLPERAYTMDTKDNLLVIGTADRHVAIFNLSNPTSIYKTLQSPLKYQTRVVSCFTTGNGFAVGSVEGRCAIQYVEDKVDPKSFCSNSLGL